MSLKPVNTHTKLCITLDTCDSARNIIDWGKYLTSESALISHPLAGLVVVYTSNIEILAVYIYMNAAASNVILLFLFSSSCCSIGWHSKTIPSEEHAQIKRANNPWCSSQLQGSMYIFG
jgi:UDP-glucose 4-epimerase